MEQQKKIHVISPSVSVSEDIKNKYRQKRVAAYCRVSTQQEEQINSYEVQTRYYTEKINAEPRNGSSSKSLLTKAFPVQAPSTVTNSIK